MNEKMITLRLVKQQWKLHFYKIVWTKYACKCSKRILFVSFVGNITNVFRCESVRWSSQWMHCTCSIKYLCDVIWTLFCCAEKSKIPTETNSILFLCIETNRVLLLLRQHFVKFRQTKNKILILHCSFQKQFFKHLFRKKNT